MTRKEGDGKTDCGKAPTKDGKRDPIDDNLKRVYEEMLNDDVPQRFEDLLRRLREQDQK
jgi:hypothetical protein